MFNKFWKQIESRRQYNRIKRFMAARAYSRCIIHLELTGAIRRVR